jgi:PAS domain S-box-containing protein
VSAVSESPSTSVASLSRRRSTALIGSAIATVYIISALFGFRLAFVAEQVTTVWAPTGIAIATLLLFGLGMWPVIWIGAFIANASTTAPVWTAGIIASGNTLEAVAAAWALRAIVPIRFDVSLRRLADVLAFLIVAGVLCTALSASIGVSALCLAGVQPWDRFAPLWWNWWLGDALGAVIVAPALLTAARYQWSRRSAVRASAFVAGTIVLTHLAFGVLAVTPHPLEFIIFPIVIAAAVAGGSHVTALVVLFASVVAIWDTARGAGPFATGEVHDSLILLQVFMGVLASSGLLLAAAVEERRASEERERSAATVLRHRDEMLRLAQRAGGVATFEWDFDRQIAECSAEFFRIFGLPAREGTITSNKWGQFVHPDDRDRMSAHLAGALSGSEPASADYRIQAADGATRWLSYGGRIETTADGRRMVGTVVDITDRKQLEADLRRHAADAEAANRLKDEFLATLSHELRTPLNAVLGWAHMLREGSVQPAMQQRALESLERNARAQAQLVEDLLDVSRIIAGKLQIASDPVDLGTIVHHAVDTVRAGVAAKGLNLHVQLPTGPRLLVIGDADRLQQVIWNLVSNAVKFTPAGGRIDVGVNRLSDAAQIEVRDTGVGIDPAFRPHLFQRFTQMDASQTRMPSGLGLGLAIVRHLVEAHGGTVTAESGGPGQGATFRVRLPLRPS